MATAKKKILQNGDVRWTIQVFKKGFKRHFITKRTQAAAEREARKVILAMESNEWDEFRKEQQKQGNTTLGYFINKYLVEITPYKNGAEKTIINETSVLNLVLSSPLAQMDIYNIKTGHIKELAKNWRDKRGNATTTVNRKLTTLSDLFGKIRVDWQHETLKNPVSGAKYKLKKGEGKRNRTLSHEELGLIRVELNKCLSPYPRWLFELALETAARRREILENTWENINLLKGWLFIPEHLSKTREERYVPLTPNALSVLNEIRVFQANTDPEAKSLFPITEKSFEEAWKKTIKRTKIRNFQFRDTRHVASTMLSKIYPRMQDLAKITGHEKLETLLLYYVENIDEQVEHMNTYYINTQDAKKG